VAAVAALFAMVSGTLFAQDTVDNPEFANWSKFKKGTSVTMKSVTTSAGTSFEATMTFTLVEVGADKLVIETSSVSKVMGMEIKVPPMKRDVPKKVEIPKGVKKEDFTSGKPMGVYEEGTETLKIGGMEIKAKWYKSKFESDGNKVESKMWISDDMPGMLVKSETTLGGKLASASKIEVTGIKKP
jgi:hypothetical protein